MDEAKAKSALSTMMNLKLDYIKKITRSLNIDRQNQARSCTINFYLVINKEEKWIRSICKFACSAKGIIKSILQGIETIKLQLHNFRMIITSSLLKAFTLGWLWSGKNVVPKYNIYLKILIAKFQLNVAMYKTHQ